MQPAESEQVEEENGQKDETDREEISRQQKYFANMYLSQRKWQQKYSFIWGYANSKFRSAISKLVPILKLIGGQFRNLFAIAKHSKLRNGRNAISKLHARIAARNIYL